MFLKFSKIQMSMQILNILHYFCKKLHLKLYLNAPIIVIYI